MKYAEIALLMCFLLLLSGCSQQQAESQQSIQDILSESGSKNITIPEKAAEELVSENMTNATLEAEEEPVQTEMIIGRKCKNSAILYEGCKWTNDSKTSFRFAIMSSSKKEIPGVWFMITGDSGGVKKERQAGAILSKGKKTYTVDYAALVKEIGVVKRFEIYPIEVMNGTEYACQNQRAYTVPEAYCKAAEAVRINEDGSINQSG